MNPLAIFKVITELGVSISVSSIVGNAIKLTADPSAKLPKRILTGLGGFVLSSMVSEIASQYAVARIDAVATAVKGILSVVNSDGEELTAEEALVILHEHGLSPLAPILVDSEAEARAATDTLDQLINEQGYATIKDVYDLFGILSTSDEDVKWGWKTLKDTILNVENVDGKANITLPPFILLDNTKE